MPRPFQYENNGVLKAKGAYVLSYRQTRLVELAAPPEGRGRPFYCFVQYDEANRKRGTDVPRHMEKGLVRFLRGRKPPFAIAHIKAIPVDRSNGFSTSGYLVSACVWSFAS